MCSKTLVGGPFFHEGVTVQLQNNVGTSMTVQESLTESCTQVHENQRHESYHFHLGIKGGLYFLKKCIMCFQNYFRDFKILIP